MTPFAFPLSWLTALLLMLAWGGTGYYAGDHNRNNAWLAQQGAAERQAREALQAAQARGDALSTGLLTQQAQINQLKLEKHEALTLATTGRPCLGSPALRVLNTAPGIRISGLPPTTSGIVAAGEPLGAAGGDSTWYSSDTDVARWAVDAGAAFEVCRARLDALIDWNTQ